MADYFRKWIKRIEVIPDFFVEEVCQEAVGLGIDSSEAEAAKDFLLYRKGQLKCIIEENKDEFSGVAQWGLD